MSLSIRQARPEEYDEVAAILVAANEEYAAIFGDEWPEYQEDLSDVASRTARGVVLVGVVDGRLVATLTYYPPQPVAERGGWWWWPEDFAAFRALAVHPSARGRGIGRALVVAAIERGRADHAAAMALNTTRQQAVARAMYERLGFHRVENQMEWGAQELLSYVLEMDGSVASTLVESEAR